jgi:uncharacterized membrane-anchored protein YjiN (DUF445 family)
VWFGGAAAGWQAHLAYALLHACEGAFVGGLCDWFAVNKTYTAVERERDTVAVRIGEWVSRDLVNEDMLAQQLDEFFHSPVTLQQLYSRLDRWLGSDAEAIRRVEEIWMPRRQVVIDYLALSDFSQGSSTLVAEAMREPRVSQVIYFCLGTAVRELATGDDATRLKKTVVELLKGFAVINLASGMISDKIVAQIREAAAELAKTDFSAFEEGTFVRRIQGSPPVRSGQASVLDDKTRAVTLLIDMLLGASTHYVMSWNKLPERMRREAAEALLDHLQKPVIAAVASFMVSQRDGMRKANTLRDIPVAMQLESMLRERVLADLPARVGTEVARSLQNTSPQEFRRNLEVQTRGSMELIRLNGTGLGFLLGAGLGAILTVILH